MKMSIFYIFAIFFAFTSCGTQDEYLDNYFDEWDITIPYQDVSKTKTYSLLLKLINYLSENFLPDDVPVHSSYLHTLYPTDFNNYLRDNEDAAEFFKRDDCAIVLMSEYFTSLKTEPNRDFYFFEVLLTSDMFMSKLDVTEKVQMMVLAFERAKYKGCGCNPFTIMISIMLSSNYTPFVEVVKPMLFEVSICNYGLRMVDTKVIPGIDKQATDFIKGFAKQFINDNK